MGETKTYQGGCHCGAVRFQVTTDRTDLLDCNCSICQKKGFLHLIVTAEQFTLLQGADQLTTYTFNTQTAKHTFCRHCGIHAFYRPRSHPTGFSVNARCLESIDLANFQLVPFDGQNWEASLADITR